MSNVVKGCFGLCGIWRFLSDRGEYESLGVTMSVPDSDAYGHGNLFSLYIRWKLPYDRKQPSWE
jgi:hypothetical protein